MHIRSSSHLIALALFGIASDDGAFVPLSPDGRGGAPARGSSSTPQIVENRGEASSLADVGGGPFG